MYHKRHYHATTLDHYVQNGTLLIFSLEEKKPFCMQTTCPVHITTGTLPILKYTWQAQSPFSSSHFLSGCIESGAAPWRGNKPRVAQHGQCSHWQSWGVLTWQVMMRTSNTVKGWIGSRSIQAFHQDEKEMELETRLETSHSICLRGLSRRRATQSAGPRSTQEAELETSILWFHWRRDWCPGLSWNGTLVPWQLVGRGLGWGWSGSPRTIGALRVLTLPL